jgi:hypothetical protein
MWSKIKLIFSAIWVFIEPLLVKLATAEGELILKTAQTVVPQIWSTSTGNWSDKVKAAGEAIAKQVGKSTGEIGLNVLNAAIEAAAAKIPK